LAAEKRQGFVGTVPELGRHVRSYAAAKPTARILKALRADMFQLGYTRVLMLNVSFNSVGFFAATRSTPTVYARKIWAVI
jgi:hypothetical protein